MTGIDIDEEWTLVDIPENTPSQTDIHSGDKTSLSYSARLGSPSFGIDFNLSYQYTQTVQHNPPDHLAIVDTSNADTAKPSSSAERITSQQEQSLLFRLPLELRLCIHKFVFRLNPPVRVIEGSQRTLSRNKPRHSVLAFLETCRLVLEEAEPIFYSINRLRIDISHVPYSLSERRRNAVQSMEIASIHAGVVERRIAELQLTPNVQSLYLTTPTGNIGYLNVHQWAIMAPQMEEGLKKALKLQEVRCLYQEGDPQTMQGWEKKRSRRLAKIVARLEAGCCR